MRPWPLLLLALFACSPEPDPAPAPLTEEGYPALPGEDPEDAYCGVTCEPGSTRPCGEGQAQVCTPEGLGWYTCGEDYPTAPTRCAKGTRCVPRPSGDPTLCSKACKEEGRECETCRDRFVLGGWMGCRAICVAGGAGCVDGQELVSCEAPTPERAAGAGCVPGPKEGSYCCPPESPIINPLLPLLGGPVGLG